jgi:flagellar L-ring protein precursor FlgH
MTSTVTGIASFELGLVMTKFFRKSNITTLMLALLCSISAVGAALADSLYPQANTMSGAVSLFSDTKAHNVGDVLTINVSETTTGNSAATTSASKSESLAYGPGSGTILSLISAFGLSGNTASTATGATNRNSGLTATISVVVKSVYPNGTMLVEGKKLVGINSEMEETTFTGIVRQVDVGPDNTVESGQVADAEIHYSGKGPIGDKQHDGLISRIAKYFF